jgi:peptidoglycan/LPS O-acetylase OafA/YrhL
MAATHFPHLDGLRFWAAALVVVDHVQQHSSNMGLPYIGELRHWEILGHLGVLMFFVLSGFLITHLLLDEQRSTGRIHYGRFQMRRILRIWPLYFLLVGLALFVFPHIPQMAMPELGQEKVMLHRPLKVVLYALFLPTLVPPLAGAVPHLGHMWSLGSEMHFYLVWPLLLMMVRRRQLLLILVAMASYPVVFRLLYSGWAQQIPHRDLVMHYWEQLNIESFATGALCAWLVFHKASVLRWLLNPRLFVAASALLVGLMGFGVLNAWVTYRLYTLLFGLVLLNLALSPRKIRIFDGQPFRYLGRISYGIYVYQIAAMVLVMNLLEPYGSGRAPVTYVLVFGLTIGVSALSFRYYEGFFQRLRKRYQAHRL